MTARELSEHDRLLKGERPAATPGPPPIPSQQDVDRHQEREFEQAQAAQRDQDQARELRRRELRAQAALRITIEIPGGSTYRGSLAKVPEAGGEGAADFGRLLFAGQQWSFYRAQVAEREQLDAPDFVHGPVRVNGVMQPCPCASKSCTFRVEALAWGGAFLQVARQLHSLGLLEEVKPM